MELNITDTNVKREISWAEFWASFKALGSPPELLDSLIFGDTGVIVGYQPHSGFKPREEEIEVLEEKEVDPTPNTRGNVTMQESFLMQAYRQGDVSIIVLKELPKRAKRVKGEPVLARGEVTGHTHRIVEGRVRLYQLAGLLYLKVLSEFAKLYHEEHEDIVLPRGDYQVSRQREFDPFREGTRYVMD